MEYKVFISSTFLDNEERRKVVEDAIIRAGMLPIAMERFTASAKPTKEECLRLVSEADLYVGIIAWRYGWIPDDEQKSITELEYEAAKAKGVDRLAFFLDDTLPVSPEKDFDVGPDRWKKQELLQAFKERITKSQMPARFNDRTLGSCVLDSLIRWSKNRTIPERGVLSRPEKRPIGTFEFSEQIDIYLKKCLALHETISLAGFETRVRVPIRLEELHVPLDAFVDLRVVEDTKSMIRHAKQVETIQGREGGHEVPLLEGFQWAKIYGNRRGLVILGDPGSGKTTHLKRLLLAVIKKGPEYLNLPADMIPVFLPLRALRDLSTGLRGFIEAELARLRFDLPEGFGRALLGRGKLLYLLDGLDEVATASDRVRVARWIEEELRISPDAHFIVTCRYAGYTQESRLSADFLEMHIRPLDREQSEKFIRNWFKIVETSVASDKQIAIQLAKESADKLIARLSESDFRASRVFALTRNPLLLTTLCLVHRDLKLLPHRRTQLYDQCINVLLERWRTAKELSVSIPADDARRILQPIALWMHQEQGRTLATFTELTPIIEPLLGKVRGASNTVANFLASIRDESGLLTGWTSDSYGFMHLGFQEYLAAREIRSRSFDDSKVLEDLAGHFRDSWWEEVILLLVALEDPSVFERFMRLLLQQKGLSERASLVQECIEDATVFSEKPFIELLERPGGKDQELWARQSLSLSVLAGRKSKELDGLVAKLGKHPSPEIQAWLRSRTKEAAQTVIRAEPGGYELVLITGGVFQMGSPQTEQERYSREGPVHKVQVPSFYLGRYPVTNEEYGRFLAANKGVTEPGYWGNRRYNQPRQPVVGVSWEDAQQYAQWAGLRLPSEAEWEYACRAGTSTRYYSGDSESDLARVGWYGQNAGGQLHPVGEKEPNAFGLYDMHGNVREWVEDDWYDSYDKAPSDGSAWIDYRRGAGRVVRGGSCYGLARYARAAYRAGGLPGERDGGLGFRLSRSYP